MLFGADGPLDPDWRSEKTALHPEAPGAIFCIVGADRRSLSNAEANNAKGGSSYSVAFPSTSRPRTRGFPLSMTPEHALDSSRFVDTR
jgi:hypothetical protein